MILSNLGQYSAVFQTEIFVILQETYLLLGRNCTGRTTSIVTDSKVAYKVVSALTDDCQ